MANRPSLRCQTWLKNITPIPSTWRSWAFQAKLYFVEPQSLSFRNFGIPMSIYRTLQLRWSLFITGRILPPREFGPPTLHRSHCTWTSHCRPGLISWILLYVVWGQYPLSSVWLFDVCSRLMNGACITSTLSLQMVAKCSRAFFLFFLHFSTLGRNCSRPRDRIIQFWFLGVLHMSHRTAAHGYRITSRTRYSISGRLKRAAWNLLRP